MSGSDTTANTARKHEMHGLKLVLPVADVSARAAFFTEILSFHVEFLHGAPPGHAPSSLGMAATGRQSSFISTTPSPDTFAQAGSCGDRARLLLRYAYSVIGQEQQYSVFRQSFQQA